MPDLITLQELLDARSEIEADLDPEDKRAAERAITAASQAISTYADRDFGTDEVTEDRTYQYDESGYLDIDDASAVTSVTMISYSVERVLDTLEWRAQPYGGPVYTYLEVNSVYGPGSPEMGFRRNEDTYFADGYPDQSLVRVSATWGWPEVPADVKQAAIWTAIAMLDDPQPYISESIAGYSRSKGFVPTESIPQRAQALLAPYIRIKV